MSEYNRHDSSYSFFMNMTKRSDDLADFDKFEDLARRSFDTTATARGMIAEDEMKTCAGNFDFDALYMGEWPPLPPGDTSAFFAVCEFRHPGSV